MLIELSNNPPCIECGLCREACPVFSVLRLEHISPRGLAILAEEQVPTLLFYHCSLCRACSVVCPVGHDPNGEMIRSRLTEQGLETEVNHEMINNIRKHGNPFGNLKEGEIPKTLTCC